MNFLTQHKIGVPGTTVEQPYRHGVLRCIYDEDGLIENISWTPASGKPIEGLQLYFDWGNEMATWKAPDSLVGQQWCAGRVALGTVYDDNGYDPGREITLGAWIEECIGKMGRLDVVE